jgi:hypothetical protein
MFRLQGQPPKFRAAEINRWNKLADQQARGELQPQWPTIANYDPSSRVAAIRNDTGADLELFSCVALDGMVWDLDPDTGTDQVVFIAIEADADKPPAILIQPLAKDQIGRAVVDGLALANVAAGSGDYATPATALEPASAGTIRLLSQPDASEQRVLPVVLNAGSGGGASAKIVQTPGGGIAARSGTSVSSASCTEFKIAGGTLATNTDTLTVYNPWPFAIPGSFYIVATQEAINGDWLAVHPGIVDVQWNNPTLQQTYDGSTLQTIDTAETCT